MKKHTTLWENIEDIKTELKCSFPATWKASTESSVTAGSIYRNHRRHVQVASPAVW